MTPKDAPTAATACATVRAPLAAAWRALWSQSSSPDPWPDPLRERVQRVGEGEERYRALVAATTDVIVQRDARGRITFADAGYASLLGRAPADLVDSTVEPEVLEQGAIETGADGVRRAEAQVRAVDGRTRWFAFVDVPLAPADGPDDAPHWLRAGRDVTARVEAQRALDAARARAESGSVAKSRFLATVSHEMRTPLNGILGMADLVLGTSLDAEQRTYVEAVRTSGKALLGLIDGILDFARIEAGRLDLAAEPFDLGALAEGVVELLAPRAQDRGLEIALDVTDDVPRMTVGDADRVRQVLINLAGNAIKFTDRGGVGVSLLRAGGGDGIVIAVSDTGPGIPQERLPTLFEEFEQGDGTAARRHEGTGLGLAITRRLVARMGGRIDVESRLGRGSIFRVMLPLAEAAEPGGEAPTRAAQRARLDGRRCLIVADSPFQAPYLARSLARAGAAAVVVGSVEDGLDALSGAAFDAVIADRALGDAGVRRLADAAASCGVHCRLVLLSPFDRREFGAPGAAGFDGYLIKPVRARSLLERLAGTGRPERAPAGPPSPSADRTGTGLRVLLAEDNPINALLATRALERLGAEVVHAADGIEALARFSDSGPFDLALIDVRMPRLDGHETAHRIRAAEGRAGGRLHLVALTANAGRADEAAARAAGFDGFLPKPLNLKALPGLLASRERRAA